MAGKLFNIYSGNTGGVLSTSTAKVGSFGTTSDNFYSVNFDTGRKSIWTNNIEFGRAADWENISDIPSWIESDGVTWANIKDKPAYATRWPSWNEVTSKPAAIGSATQPVYWDGSTFQVVNAIAPGIHDHDDRYLKLTGGTLSGDLAFSHGSSTTDQHITWASGTHYQRLKVRDGQTDVFIFQYSTDSGTTWSDYFTIQNGTAKIGSYTVYHSGNLPAYPTVNNGALNLQVAGTTKVTFYANQSGTSNFNIATGSNNGTISVAGIDVAVKGLGSNAYSSTAYLPLAGGQMTGNISWKNATALPEQSEPQYFLVIDAFDNGGATKWTSKANTLRALTGLTSTSKGTTSKPIYWDGTKFVECLAYSQANVNYANSAGSVDWGNVKNKPSTFAPSAHDHTRILYIDDRDTIETPTDVAGKNGIEIHFKNKSKSGITSDGTWTAVIMLDGYSDVSGGYPMELGFSMSDLSDSRPLYLRTPKSSTEWGDWRTILDSKTYTDFTVKKDGTGATGSWNINAATATKLQNKRTITINGSSKSFDGSENISWSLADLNLPSNEHNHDGRYLKLSGGTLTGVLHLLGAQYADTANTGALDLANSDIYGVNSIKFADLAESAGEGLQWYRDATHVDSLWIKNGVIYFSPNRTWGGSVTNYTVWHSGNDSTGSGLDADLLDGVHANGLFTNFSNKTVSGNKVLAATIGGKELTVAVEYAGSAGNANILNLSASVGTDSDTHATALQNYFNANKSSIQRNKLNTYYSSAYGNGSFYMGYFLSGYDSAPYGGFFVAHYGTPYYVGITNGTYNEQTILTSSNYTNYTVKKDGTGASGTWGISITGNAKTANSAGDADTLDNFHANGLFQTFTNDSKNNAVKIKIGNTEKSLVVGYATKAGSANSATSAEYAEYLAGYTSQDPNTCSKGTGVKLFYNLNTNSGYAGTNYGFPCTNNANAILWIGAHSGLYGGQLGISSNRELYYRYISYNSFPTTANGGSWNKILTTANWSSTTDGRYLRWAGNSADVTAMNWGTLTAANGYTILSHGSSSDGGDMGFVNKGGQIFMQLDGYYYQNEGRYRVTDVSETVTALGTSGNYLTWTKNGTTNSITVPYASNADTVDNKHAADFLYRLRRANLDMSHTVNGMIPPAILELKNAGYPVYTDPEFANDVNSVWVYNNSGGNTVTITRIDDTEGVNSTGKILQIRTSGTASPYAGGFYQTITSRKNAIFAQIFRAKIPVGYSVTAHENPQGSGSSTYFLTDTRGTGKWEWYVRLTYCGTNGSFSGGGHIALNVNGEVSGLTNTSVTWYVSYCNLIDITKGNYDGLRTRFADRATSSDSASSVAWANITGKATSKTAWGQTFVDSSGNIQSISGNMTSVGQITPDSHAARDNGTSSANWASVYSYALRSNDNLTLRSGTSKDIIFQTNAGTEHMRLLSGGTLILDPGSVSNWGEGLRIHQASNGWTTLALGGTSNSGTSAAVWSLHTYQNNFYLANNGSSSFTNGIKCVGGVWSILSSGNIGIGTSSPSQKLHVNGAGIFNNTGSTSYNTDGITIGAGDHTARYITAYGKTGTSYFNMGYSASSRNCAELLFNYSGSGSDSNYAGLSMYGGENTISVYAGYTKSTKYINAPGFVHPSYNSASYLLTSNGGAKQWSTSKVANTIVTRTGDNFVYAGYYNSDISDENSISVGSVYVRNTSDNFIRRQSISKFADNLRADEIITITKDLTVTEAWMDTGIVMNTTTFPRGTGTYAIQIASNTNGTDGWYPYYSGIMSIYTAGTNGSLADEVPLHCIGHSNDRDNKRIYIRTVEQANSSGKIQIAAASTISSHTYTFKFRKLI